MKIPPRKNFDLTNLVNQKMPEYCEFKDKNLSQYFTNERRISHLKENGLITEQGFIINNPEQYMKRKELYNQIVAKNLSVKKEKEKVVSPKKIQAGFKNPYDEVPPLVRSRLKKRAV